MRERVFTSILAALLVGAGCCPVTWMGSSKLRISDTGISDTGPSLGTLRHRDRQYDLRKTLAAGTARADDPFVKDFNSHPAIAEHDWINLDGRSEIDAVAVEDHIADLGLE